MFLPTPPGRVCAWARPRCLVWREAGGPRPQACLASPPFLLLHQGIMVVLRARPAWFCPWPGLRGRGLGKCSVKAVDGLSLPSLPRWEKPLPGWTWSPLAPALAAVPHRLSWPFPPFPVLVLSLLLATSLDLSGPKKENTHTHKLQIKETHDSLARRHLKFLCFWKPRACGAGGYLPWWLMSSLAPGAGGLFLHLLWLPLPLSLQFHCWASESILSWVLASRS